MELIKVEEKGDFEVWADGSYFGLITKICGGYYFSPTCLYFSDRELRQIAEKISELNGEA